MPPETAAPVKPQAISTAPPGDVTQNPFVSGTRVTPGASGATVGSVAPDGHDCGTCRWWIAGPAKAGQAKRIGLCHRRPPVVFEHEKKVVGYWPRTTSHEFCGDWQARKDAK